MGIKCPHCKSTNTISNIPNKMHCQSCSHVWTPYKHRGKKMKPIGDGIWSPIRKVVPSSKTEIVGDGIIFAEKRVKKQKVSKNSRGIV